MSGEVEVAALAEAICPRASGPCRTCGEAASRMVASDWLAAREARARAEGAQEALVAARDNWQQGEWTVLTAPIKAETQPQRIIGAAQAVTDWLRERAEDSDTTLSAAVHLAEENRRLRDILERIETLAADGWTMEDHYGNETGPLVFVDDLLAALSADDTTPPEVTP